MGTVTCYSHAAGRQIYAEYAAFLSLREVRHKDTLQTQRTCATVNIHPYATQISFVCHPNIKQIFIQLNHSL